MRNVHRYFRFGDIVFLTHVTHRRQPLLVDNADILHWSVEQQRRKSPFDILAWVILPDHWHLIVDPKGNHVPALMQRIKATFTAKYRLQGRLPLERLWQNRYWDHIIRDQRDLNRHFDYIHFNPVKHGLVSSPGDFPHSSFATFVSQGLYRSDWGMNPIPETEGEFGE